eukprot:70224-Chlamydomonas_euryale.AAC.1
MCGSGSGIGRQVGEKASSFGAEPEMGTAGGKKRHYKRPKCCSLGMCTAKQAAVVARSEVSGAN